MSYNPSTDFLGLLRTTGGGVRAERTPGLDYVVVALARAGLFKLVVGQTAPTSNQAQTAWFQPAIPSWISEGTLFLWNAVDGAYEVATPALWIALLSPSSAGIVVQDVITAAGNVQVNASVVRVQNVGVPVALAVPLSSAVVVPSILISDWANHAGANPITLTLSGADIFPGGGNTWVIGADTASVCLRPVPGGFAL